MIRRPPRSTRTDTLFPYTTLFRSCTAISRVIVLNSLHDDLTEALVQAIKKIKVGPAWDPEATMGPLITDEHRVSVLRTLAAGLSDGGQMCLGGRVLEDGDLVQDRKSTRLNSSH